MEFKSNIDKIKRSYSCSEVVFNIISVVRSKFIDKRIRLIRFPIILRGRKYIDFGEKLTTGYWCRLEALPMNDQNYKRLVFGSNIQINDFVHISAVEKVEIGDNCLMASHIYISDNSHGLYSGKFKCSSPEVAPVYRDYMVKPVKIGKNCWLGEGVIIMPGVTIGDGCIIGAHSVVTKDIPENSIAVGTPANVVKQYNTMSHVWEKLLYKEFIV